MQSSLRVGDRVQVKGSVGTHPFCGVLATLGHKIEKQQYFVVIRDSISPFQPTEIEMAIAESLNLQHYGEGRVFCRPMSEMSILKAVNDIDRVYKTCSFHQCKQCSSIDHSENMVRVKSNNPDSMICIRHVVPWAVNSPDVNHENVGNLLTFILDRNSRFNNDLQVLMEYGDGHFLILALANYRRWAKRLSDYEKMLIVNGDDRIPYGNNGYISLRELKDKLLPPGEAILRYTMWTSSNKSSEFVPPSIPEFQAPRISQNLEIHVRYWSMPETLGFMLRQGGTYFTLVNEIREALRIPYDESDISLFVQCGTSPLKAPMYKKIARPESASIEPSTEYSTLLTDLRDIAMVTLRTTRDNVSAVQPIITIKADSKFSEQLNSKVENLCNTYSAWRSIRGDGNCYYRCVMFGLVEQIIANNRYESFLALRGILERVHVPNDPNVRCSHSKLLDLLASAKDRWPTVDEFESQVLNPDTGLDIALICAARYLVGEFLITNRHRELNGSSFESIITAISGMTLEQYCNQYIYPLGEDAEGAFVDAGVLFEALNCVGTTVMLDRQSTIAGRANSTGSAMSLGSIHLLWRPGHYDLLYIDESLSAMPTEAILSQLLDSKLVSNALPRAQTQARSTMSKFSAICNDSRRIVVLTRFPLVATEGIFFHDKDAESILSQRDLSQVSSRTAPLHTRVIMNYTTREQLRANIASMPTISSPDLVIRGFSRGDLIDSIVFNEHNNNNVFANDDLGADDNDEYTILFDRIVTVWIKVECDGWNPADSDYLVTISLIRFNSAQALLEALSIRLNLPETAQIDEERTPNYSQIRDGDVISIITVIPLFAVQVRLKDKSTTIMHNNRHDTLDNLINYNRAQLREALDLPETVSISVTNKMNREIHSNAVIDVVDSSPLTIIFCSSGERCSDRSCRPRSTFIQSNDLVLCSPCLDSHVGKARSLRQQINSAATQTNSIFRSPPEEVLCRDDFDSNDVNINDYVLPISMNNIPLSLDLVQRSTPFQLDSYSFQEELERWKNSRIECNLKEFYTCDGYMTRDSPEAMSLGCDHFFHIDCMRGFTQHKLSLARGKETTTSMTLFACPRCVVENRVCTCPSCTTNNDANVHIISVPEFETLGLDGKLYVEWRTRNTLWQSRDSKFVQCRCGEGILLENNAKEHTCTRCRRHFCVLCSEEVHPDKTCEQNRHDMMIEDARRSGFKFLRPCPNCNKMWDMPIDCYHVTCTSEGGPGCGFEFCFLCSTNHRVVVAHDNSYHHPRCPLYEACCDRKCTDPSSQPSADYCASTTPERRYLPRTDRKCSSCTRKNIDCTHTWCPQCDNLKEACKPLRTEQLIFDIDELRAEQNRLDKKSGNISESNSNAPQSESQSESSEP